MDTNDSRDNRLGRACYQDLLLQNQEQDFED